MSDNQVVIMPSRFRQDLLRLGINVYEIYAEVAQEAQAEVRFSVVLPFFESIQHEVNTRYLSSVLGRPPEQRLNFTEADIFYLLLELRLTCCSEGKPVMRPRKGGFSCM